MRPPKLSPEERRIRHRESNRRYAKLYYYKKNPRIQKECSQCGLHFSTCSTWGRRKYCSPDCAKKTYAKARQSRVTPRICVVCGSQFIVRKRPSGLERGPAAITCSPTCETTRLKHVMKVWRHANKDHIVAYRKKRKHIENVRQNAMRKIRKEKNLIFPSESREWRKNYQHRHYLENKELILAQTKEYYKKHKKRMRLANKEWTKKNYDKFKEHQRRYKTKWREKILETQRRYHETGPLQPQGEEQWLRKCKAILRTASRINQKLLQGASLSLSEELLIASNFSMPLPPQSQISHPPDSVQQQAIPSLPENETS